MKVITLIILILLLLSTPIYCDVSESSCVTLREYVERILAEQNKALIIGQSSLDSKFVRIEAWLKDTGIYNDKINALNAKLTNQYVKFSEQINALGERVTIIETKLNQNAENSKQISDSFRSWIIGLGLFFTVIQIVIVVWNKNK